MLVLPLRAQDLSTIDEAEPVTISGTAFLQGQHYHSSLGNRTGRPDITGFLTFNPTVTVYGIQFPFSFSLTTSEATFRQPFNEFGVSPRYKWITGHFGYRSVRFSQFSLASQRWLGAGFELQSAGFRLGAMYGRFQKAMEGDTVRRAPAIYKRMGLAFKLGWGSDRNNVDIVLFKGWDDSTSVSSPSLRPLAGENVVLALVTRFGLLDNTVTIDAEIAGSVYTRDLGAPEERVSGVPSVMKSVLRLTSSTRANWALRSAATYTGKRFRITLKYERVEPDFASMGVGYISQDREDITLAPTLSLFSSLRLTGSIGVRRNNLINDKLTTTHRLISSFGASWQVTDDFGWDMRYTNYSTSSSDGRVRITDTMRIENVSQMIGGGPRIALSTGDVQHTISLYAMHQRYDDRNLLSGALNNNETTSGTLGIGSAIGEFGLTGSVSYADAHSSAYATKTFNLSLGATKSFFEGTLSLALSVGYGVARSASATDAQFLPAINGSYRLSDRDMVTFTSQLSQNTRTNAPYTEIVTSAGYSRTF